MYVVHPHDHMIYRVKDYPKCVGVMQTHHLPWQRQFCPKFSFVNVPGKRFILISMSCKIYKYQLSFPTMKHENVAVVNIGVNPIEFWNCVPVAKLDLINSIVIIHSLTSSSPGNRPLSTHNYYLYFDNSPLRRHSESIGVI